MGGREAVFMEDGGRGGWTMDVEEYGSGGAGGGRSMEMCIV